MSEPPAPVLLGGWSEARPATPDIQEIADKVKPQLEAKTNESYQEFKAIEYKSQVVAGTNYHIKVQVDGNRYIHIQVFEPLGGPNEESLELSGYQTGKSREDEITDP